MPPIFSFFGYRSYDPLDDAPSGVRYLLTMGSTAVLSVLLLYVVFDVLHIATLKYGWLFWVECAFLALLYAPAVCALRKSSSLVHIGLLVASVVPLDLFLEARYRAYGLDTLWMYTNDGPLGGVQPLLRILIGWLGDALVCGVLALWVARVVARIVFRKQHGPAAGLIPGRVESRKNR